MDFSLQSHLAFLPSSGQRFPLHSQSVERRRFMATCSSQQETKAGKAKKVPKRRQRVANSEIQNFRQIATVSVGDQFLARVNNVGPADSNWLDLGVVTSAGLPVHGRLRFQETPRSKVRKEEEGAVLPVYIWKIQPASGRIECRRGSPPLRTRHSPPEDARMLADVELGEEMEATIIAVGAYGALLDANVYRVGKKDLKFACNGLLSRKRFQQRWACASDVNFRDDVERVLEVGQKITVWVRAAYEKNGMLWFDANRVSKQQLEEERAQYRTRVRKRLRRDGPDVLKIGEQRKGFVREVAKYGLFIDIGLKNDGLIHFKQMGEKHRWDWKDTIPKDTDVVTEVLKVEGKRIALKLVAVSGDEEEEGSDTALSPTARLNEVAQINSLQGASQSKRRLAEETELQGENGELVSSEEEEQGDDEIDDEEEGDDDDYKFSDEYFEDKYGY